MSSTLRPSSSLALRKLPLCRLPLLLLLLLVVLCVVVTAQDDDGDDPVREGCSLVCENGGNCELGAQDELFERYEGLNLPFLEKSSQEMTEDMHCVCPPGFIGVRCEVALAPCGDDDDYTSAPSDRHVCFHGAKCKEGISDAGQEFFYCDCTAAGAGAVDPLSFAGRMCEHASTVFCGRGDPNPSRHTFCTNGGTCVEENVDINDEHPGCICPSGWEGRHCQYVLGTAPESEALMELLHQPPPTPAQKDSGGGSGGSKRGHLSFLLIITVVCVSSAFLILVVMREVHKDMARSSTQEAVVNPNPIRPSATVHDSERGLGSLCSNHSDRSGALGGPLTHNNNNKAATSERLGLKSSAPPSTIMEHENMEDEDGVMMVDVDDDDSSSDGVGGGGGGPTVNELL